HPNDPAGNRRAHDQHYGGPFYRPADNFVVRVDQFLLLLRRVRLWFVAHRNSDGETLSTAYEGSGDTGKPSNTAASRIRLSRVTSGQSCAWSALARCSASSERNGTFGWQNSMIRLARLKMAGLIGTSSMRSSTTFRSKASQDRRRCSSVRPPARSLDSKADQVSVYARTDEQRICPSASLP